MLAGGEAQYWAARHQEVRGAPKVSLAAYERQDLLLKSRLCPTVLLLHMLPRYVLRA